MLARAKSKVGAYYSQNMLMKFTLILCFFGTENFEVTSAMHLLVQVHLFLAAFRNVAK